MTTVTLKGALIEIDHTGEGAPPDVISIPVRTIGAVEVCGDSIGDVHVRTIAGQYVYRGPGELAPLILACMDDYYDTQRFR